MNEFLITYESPGLFPSTLTAEAWGANSAQAVAKFARQHPLVTVLFARPRFLAVFMDQAAKVLERVSYQGWLFAIEQDGYSCYLIASFRTKDVVTGSESIQRTRKWRLSHHMTPSEIVQTAFLATLVGVEHEVREEFTFDGQQVFGPHFDVGALAYLAATGATDARKEAA